MRYQLRALVSDIPNCWIDRVPGKRLARLALVEHDLLRALRCCRRVNPLPGQLGRQHNRSPVVNIDHAAGAIGGDDDEPMLLGLLILEPGELANRGAEDR